MLEDAGKKVPAQDADRPSVELVINIKLYKFEKKALLEAL